ncbi:MAG: nitrile hydratase subunit beta [Rhodobacteraceae bacterium]|nr:nitrile hydratase subunit beta [Paracoccaceae bacterium]
MTRIHDMGGRFGDGAIAGRSGGRVFEERWHARALALTLAAGALGHWNIDMSRHSRECLPPKDYQRFSYYEKWLAALADLLVRHGLVTCGELSDPERSPACPAHQKILRPAHVATVLGRGLTYTRPVSGAAKFANGAMVRTRRHTANPLVIGGHTRLPAYACGRRGRIVGCHGAQVLPDSNAHGLGEAPEWLYSVEFAAAELWGPDTENPDDTMVLDAFESYLEAV